MAMITELNCNLREAVHVKYLDGNLFSQDVYGNAIRVIVMDGDEPATLAGTVSGTAIREDGSTVALTDSRIDENVATVVLPAAAYAVPGVLAITIKISDTNTVTTLAYVVANVYRTSTDTVVDPGTIIPSITTLIEQIAQAVASIPADYSSLWAALAETFNASKSGGYAVGEYVTYDGGLYRFKNAHTGSWSSSDVDAVNLGSGIAKNASDISELKSALSENTVNLWTYGNVSGTRAVSKVFNFVSGKKYTVSCKITSTRTDTTKSRVSITDSDSHEKMYTTLVHDGSRVSYTFTAVANCKRIVFYSANTSTNSTGYDVSVTEIQIEEGETMTAYVPPVTATDFIARNRLTVVETDLGNISEKNDEQIRYTFSDKSGTGQVNIKFDFETGKTYTIYAKITSADTGTNSLIRISDAYSHVLTTGTIAHDGTRHSFEFTASAGANRVYFFAASTKAASEGLTISVTDIEIMAGSESHMFPNGITAVDYVARANINDIINNPSSNAVELLSNNTYTGSDTDTFEIQATDISLCIPVVYCEAMFTRTSGVTDYPRIRMEMTNARDLTRYSIYYKVGSEGQYASHEWRAPAFLWGKKSTTIRLVVPEGCSLTIRKMGYRYENCVDRTNARGINFFARPGTCNMVPELSEPAVQMALRHGYDTFTVIPKISSDGVWFCYHDDRWVETGDDKTYMVNSDGSAITEDQYNNLQFHQIPFDNYLDQFVTGGFGSTFYTTKLMKLEDCCAILAKTGMKLRFSMHPSTGVNDHLASLKRLVQKYGLLKDLSIIVNDISALFTAFGNDIGCYCFPNATGSSWESGAAKPVNSGFVAAQAAKTTYGITVPINCGLWVDSLFADMDKAEQLVSDILDEGFTAGAFAGVAHDTIDGATRTGNETVQLWSEDVRWLMSIGVTEITEGNNTSLGLDW